MTRMRGVKPDLLRHEGLLDLEEATGLPIRLCFIGLLMCADRHGRFQWRPRTLKAEVMPHDVIDFSVVLDGLERGDFVRRYEVDGKTYGWIPAFTKHQHINIKEAKSIIPPCPDEMHSNSPAITGESTCPDSDGTQQSECPDTVIPAGSEGKGIGKEGKGISPAGEHPSHHQKGKAPLQEWLAYSATLIPPFPEFEAERAWNHYESNGWRVGKAKAPSKDWRACCRTCHGYWKSESATPTHSGPAPLPASQKKLPGAGPTPPEWDWRAIFADRFDHEFDGEWRDLGPDMRRELETLHNRKLGL